MNVNEFEVKYKETAGLIEGYALNYSDFSELSPFDTDKVCRAFLTECDDYIVDDILSDHHIEICELISSTGGIDSQLDIKRINNKILGSIYSMYYNDFDEYFLACNIYRKENDELNRRIAAYKESKLAA